MKQKTHKATKKRVKVTKGGKGKKMFQKAAQNHLLVNKSKKAKRDDYKDAPDAMEKQLSRLLPNN